MALIAYPENVQITRQINAMIAGPDSLCDECGRDLYAGLDHWTRCETDDGAGGSEVVIVCDRCHEDQYDEFMAEYDAIFGPVS